MKRFSTIVLGLALFTSGCGSDDNKSDIEPGEPDPSTLRTETWELAHYESTCVGLGPTWCLNKRVQGEEDYSLLYSGIDGFSFEAGNSYVLEVDVMDVPKPLADGSSLYFKLKTEVSRNDESDEEFAIWLDSEGTSFAEAGDRGLITGRDFTCATPQVCSEVETHLDSGKRVAVNMNHADGDTPMTIQSISEVQD